MKRGRTPKNDFSFYKSSTFEKILWKREKKRELLQLEEKRKKLLEPLREKVEEIRNKGVKIHREGNLKFYPQLRTEYETAIREYNKAVLKADKEEQKIRDKYPRRTQERAKEEQDELI